MSSRLVVGMGRFHTYSLDGQRVPSVTGVAGTLDKPGLMYAAVRECATWCAIHADELAERGQTSWINDARNAHRQLWDKAAADGTAVHAIAERLVWGEPVPDEDADGLPFSDDVRRMGEQVARFMDVWNVEPVMVEAPVFNEVERYAGRLDLVADMGGQRWLVDYKSGASGIYPETALQLSGYAHATHWQNGDVDLPMPEVERYAGLWVRPDGWELQPLTVTDDTWRVFRACLFLKNTWGPVKREDVVGAALPVPDGGAAA